MSKAFLLTSHLSKELIRLKEFDQETYICHNCNGQVKQIAPNPHVWLCLKCHSEYTGPLFEK